LAVDSITRTLEANVPQIEQLKILIHGQEVETLAGHLDLSQPFRVDRREEGRLEPPVRSGSSVLRAPIQKAIETVKGETKPKK